MSKAASHWVRRVSSSAWVSASLASNSALAAVEVFAELGFVLPRLFGGAHLFELHVEFEGLFEEVFGDDLLFLRAGGAGGLGGGLGLLFELDAFELEEVFGAGDGVLEGAVGVVEVGGFGQGGLLLGGGSGGETVGVEPAGEGVEGLFEGGGVEVELGREGEEGEVVRMRGGVGFLWLAVGSGLSDVGRCGSSGSQIR